MKKPRSPTVQVVADELFRKETEKSIKGYLFGWNEPEIQKIKRGKKK